MYRVEISKKAAKDLPNIKAANLWKKLVDLLKILENNPYQNPPPFEHLRGNLSNFYSRRINIQHRLVYQIDETTKVVRVASFWSHYENV